MKSSIFLFLCGISLLFASRVNAQQSASSWITGNWEGIGYQPGVSTWTISLVADEEGQGSFQISYPSLDCGGTWSLQKEEGGVYWFKESLAYGRSNCVDQVTVAITRVDANHITFSCFNPNTLDLSSYSTLVRVPLP